MLTFPCTRTHVGCYARCWVGVGGDVNVPCTCTHVGCYARCWVGVGGMSTFLALAHMLDFTLRAKEVQLGRKQLESLTLKGRVAADATVICKVYVSVRSEAWKHHILAWKAKRRNQDLPPCFMGHIRCAGLVERGDDAKLLCVPLPLELQSAGSRPPTESTYDAQSSELLSKLDVQNTHLFSDGNRAWAKCAQEAGIEWSQVKHSVNHRTMTHKGPKPPLQEPPVLGRKNSAASCRPTSLRESTGDGDGAMESSAGSSRSCWN